jgi:predicted RNase H-like HicB family nuclease
MEIYNLRIVVEELDDTGDYKYLATSANLPNLIVAGDTPDEVLGLAPQVASALIASMKAHGDKLPTTLHAAQSLPFTSQAAVVA